MTKITILMGLVNMRTRLIELKDDLEYMIASERMKLRRKKRPGKGSMVTA